MREPDSKPCVGTLLRKTVDLSRASQLSVEGGIPNEPGFYAWWMSRGALPQVPGKPHPDEADLDLLYVGIAPVSAASTQTLRTRVLSNHCRGNTGSSTFRLSLASLLMDSLGLHPLRKEKKVVLSQDENKALSDWQQENLRVSWCVREEPWKVEGEVITALEPPVNLAGNGAHPFHATMRAARKRFRASAA